MSIAGEGLCACGCGERTVIARKNDARQGMVKGQPQRFVYGHQWRGNASVARDGNKAQAHKRVKYLVRTGQLPPVRTRRCTDCGGPARDYDHHLGYDVAHHGDVEPVCRLCHIQREKARRG